MNAKEWAGTRAGRSLLIVLCLLLHVLGSAGATATQTAPSLPSLDPACIRFDDPNAVVNGEIVYAGFTAYESGLDHAVDAWSPARGFAVAFREAIPAGDAVPEEANLIYRDVEIPGSAFKGVTVTWAHAPATITLNRSTLPSPETTDPLQQELIRAVVTHETGHALGLGDVPTPGVNIRECANMLMKRSVDKGGGHFTEPQPADIALYCMRWGGAICGDDPAPIVTPDPDQGLALEPHAVASPAPPVQEPAHDRVSLSGRDLRADPGGGHHARAGRERQPAPRTPGAAASARRPASCSTSIGTTGAARSC